MSIDHLAEEQLQAFIEKKSLDNQVEIENHLRTCEYCRLQLTAYQHVYAEFNSEPEFSFSNNFEDLIIEKIIQVESSKFQLKDYLFWSIATIAGIAVMVNYLLKASVGSIIARILLNNWISLKRMFNFILETSEQMNVNIEFILFAAIILIILGLSDRIIFNLKQDVIK